MKRSPGCFTVGVLAFCLLCLPGLASAYAYMGQGGPPPETPKPNQTTGVPVIWADNRVQLPFTLNLGSDFVASAVAAMAEWNATDTRLQLVQGGHPGIVCNGGDRVNVVGWRDRTCEGEAFGDALAITVVSFRYPSTTLRWEIVDTDILLNQNRAWFPNQPGPMGGVTDFRRVVLHEFGHTFGLEHPDEADQHVDAIMNSQLSDLDALQADDMDGIVFLYGGSANHTPIAASSSGGGGADAALALLAAFGLLYRSRDTRRKG